MSSTGSTPLDTSVDLVGKTGLLAQITEVSADAIFSEDLDGAIMTWNSAAERLYGSSAEEMIGRNAADFFTTETVTQLKSAHELAMSGERVERFDTWHQRPDGRHVAVSLTVWPLRTAAGELAGVAPSVQDVTERVRLTAEIEDVYLGTGVLDGDVPPRGRPLLPHSPGCPSHLRSRSMTGVVRRSARNDG